MDTTDRVRRSLLICPGDRRDLITKLARSQADVCVIELEDGVAMSQKEVARRATAELLGSLEWGPRERIVRINRVLSADGEKDIEVVADGEPDGILLPKVEHVDEIRLAADLLVKAESAHGMPSGSIAIWAMIEASRGLNSVVDICAASDRMTGVVFGGGDYGADIRVKRLGTGSFRRVSGPAFEYLYARGRVVAAARAAGIDPIDSGLATIQDDDGTRQSAEYSAQMGFTGCIIFSPRQVPPVHEAFHPPAEDIEWAEEILAAADRAAAEDGTISVVDGDIVDGPFNINARDILDRVQAFAARDLANQGGA
jgi:citrate lyase subunit beta/citryl-CoA lyase